MRKGQIFYGWVIVAIAGLGLFFSGPGQTYSISIFIDAYIREFGWSRSVISSYYSIATLAAGLILFLVGNLVDKYGQRKMLLAVGLLLACACFWKSALASLSMLFLGFFMLRLFGQGSLSLIPSTLVPQWFVLKRGRALSFMAIGSFLSAAILPPLNSWIIAGWGWSTAWLVWGFSLLLVFLPLVFFFARDKPEDMGLAPDNLAPQLFARPGAQIDTPAEESWTLKEAMQNRVFWFLLFCTAIPPLLNTGITFHLVSMLGEKGIEPFYAATILSVMAVAGFIFSFLAGFLLERVAVKKVLVFFFIGEILVLFLLKNINHLYMAFLFGLVWGFVVAFERITINIAWPNYFGRKHLGSIRGISMTVIVIASSLGPLPFALAYDYFFQSYNEIILLVMLLPVAGMVAAYFSPSPRKDRTISATD